MPTAQPTPPHALTEIFADLAQVFGLSRPAGQCFAAIWRAASPPCADDLVAELGLARSNVSTALKELRSWNLIGAARAPGDRKDYFTAPTDAWDLLRLLVLARQRHLITPLLDRLITAEAQGADSRLAALHEALERANAAIAVLASVNEAAFTRRLGATADDDARPKKKKKKR